MVTGPLDERVRDRIVAEARGNPLALLELPARGLPPRSWPAASGVRTRGPLSSQIEQGFLRRVESLPAEARRLLFTAAAEPVGDVTLLRRAAERLGIEVDAAVSHAEASELITLGTRVRFRHPLVRSAAYRAARPARIAGRCTRRWPRSTDAEARPRSSGLAPGARGGGARTRRWLPNWSARRSRAQARGGIAAAAAFLERAAELTQDPARRAQRALEAAQAKFQAGAFGPAGALLARAEAGPLDELRRARIDVLHAEIAFALGRGKEAPRCCSPPLAGSSSSTSRSLVRPTWKRSRR